MSYPPPHDVAYPLGDEAGQPRVPIAGYANTITRNPARKLLARPLTRTERTGPLGLAERLRPGDGNLAADASGRMAQGSLIRVSGRVLDEDGRALSGAVVELWQANAAGRYRNPLDRRDAPLDPNFVGNGRTLTDMAGRFSFMTIKPGAYPVPDSGHWWRPPHIHFSVFGPSSMSRLVTQMYFPGEPLNATDRLILSIPDPAFHRLLIARFVDPAVAGEDFLAFEHDLVLRGRDATPHLP